MTYAAFEIVTRLKEAHRAALSLFGDGYGERIAPFREFVKRKSKQENVPVAKACLDLMKITDRHGTEGDKIAAMAACFEEMSAPRE